MRTVCRREFKASGVNLEQFAAEHVPVRLKARAGRLDRPCQVNRDGTRCGRLAHCRDLCHAHHSAWLHRRLRNPNLALEDWLSEAIPYPAEERSCCVPMCEQQVFGRRELCRYHYYRHLRDDPARPAAEWAATATPYLTGGQFSLLPLRPLVRAELLYVLQRRDARGGVINPKVVRMLVTALAARTHLVGVPAAQLLPGSSGRRTEVTGHLNEIARWLTIGHEQMTEVEPTRQLVWDLRNLDLRDDPRSRGVRMRSGEADFTRISQPWLRELTMHRCHAYTTSGKIRQTLTAVEVASRRLETTADGGHDRASLGAQHLAAITEAFRTWSHPDGRARSNTRRYVGLETVMSLLDFGRRAGLMDDIPSAFTRDRAVHRLQLDKPASDENGKAIPEPIIAELDRHLDSLTCCVTYPGWSPEQVTHMMRTLYIVLRDTGRRPREVCTLRMDCLDHDRDGTLLIWDNHKAHRRRRRLPVTAPTATAIADWREARRGLHGGDRRDDYLFPARTPDLPDPYFTTKNLADSLRAWVDAIPELPSDTVDAHGRREPFDRRRIYPYAFRHSYAQRHADADVPIDVLRDLMDHKQISTTQTYYRVTLKRKRDAVRTLRLQVVDRTGRPTATGSNIAYELRSVAAPFGNCTEPSNVKAGGGACPIRFQCAGCGFYRPDPSYIPAIEDHILALRADREKAMAMDVDEFVLRNLTSQIIAYQHVLDSMRTRLDALDPEQRREVDDASAVLRKVRAGTMSRQLPLTPARASNDQK